ncbi:MAG: hypothetical protein PF588_01115 [Candidatus Kapabacteria bacterium]|jgi:hypothetical protein|nr:hypothetical protein [Candidatus Kapabacteria bacterium]
MSDHTIPYIVFGIVAIAIGSLLTITSRRRMRKFIGNDFVRFQPMFDNKKKKTIHIIVFEILAILVILSPMLWDSEFHISDMFFIAFNLFIINGFWFWNIPFVYVGESGLALTFSWRAHRDTIKQIIIPHDVGQELCSYKVIFNTDRKLLKIDIMRKRREEFEKLLNKYKFPIE